MAYLVKANKPDLLEICEEIGIEIDPSTEVVDLKKIILKSQLHDEEEVKIIIERILNNRKEEKAREDE